MSLSAVDLLARLNTIYGIFSAILGNQAVFDGLDAEKRQQFVTGLNKSYGQAESFRHEFLTTQKAQGKGRPFLTQTHADVTVGAADALFAKSIECKSVTKPEKGAVNHVIRDEAIGQLAGTTGHLPRDGDVRVVDLKITCSFNPWPMPGGAYGQDRKVCTLSDLMAEAVKEVDTIVYGLGANEPQIMAWLKGEGLANVNSIGRLNKVVNTGTGQTDFPSSSRPIGVTATGGIQKIRCLTVKVRYEPAYTVSEGMELKWLDEIVVQAYKRLNGKVEVDVAKIKGTAFDYSQGFPALAVFKAFA
jgi:hypothetical protein